MIRRDKKYEILDDFKRKQITILIGARQVGKTTLIKEIISEQKNSIYFNLDIEQDYIYFSSQQKLLQKIQLEAGTKKTYVFIDEIQQKPDAGRFLKGLFDMNLPYKFIVTGSGSIELKEKINEALTGRKHLIIMPSVTFKEFVDYRTGYKYSNRLSSFFEVETEQTEMFLNEYLNFGGYPAVITAETITDKKEVMNEIFRSYITKDISFLLKVKHPDKFVKLIQLLAIQSGCIINYSQLAQDTGLSVETLKTYLWYAEQTFIINIVKPYFTNYKKELTKSPTVYFNDLGMCNFSKSNFGFNISNGMLFQNFVYLLLKEKYEQGLNHINYWRTKDKAEVDFILHTDKGVLPVEVKYSNLKKTTVSRSFRSFIKKYSPTTAYIINLSLDTKIIIDNTIIKFIPFWKFIA